MKTPVIPELVRRVAARIAAEYHPRKIILFGSYAYGDPGPDSDVDLLIVKNTEEPFIREQQKVRRIIDGEIAADVLIRSEENLERRVRLGDFFLKEILTRGICLYEA